MARPAHNIRRAGAVKVCRAPSRLNKVNGATGLRYVAEANQRLKGIAQGNNVKTELAAVMDMENNDNDAVIVRSTIELAHNLGLKVIAEGVETRAAWDTLTILGCDSSQGYLMGKPIPADKLETRLRESAWSRVSTTALYVP